MIITAMRLFEYDTRYKAEKWEAKAAIREKPFVLKVEQHFNPLETISVKRGFLGEKSLLDTPKKRSRRKKQIRSLAQEVKIFNPEDAEVVAA